jgi:glycosyltransferase involved in cell wall biosynthesis
MTEVVVVHDYLTQRGGAERVALELVRAFPGARLVTSIYQPDLTFPEFADIKITELGLARIPAFRRDVRSAFPVLAPLFTSRRVDADVVVCSSSGWAHGIGTSGKKLVYCHTPARWLYEPDDYLGPSPPALRRRALRTLGPLLRRWDRWAAHRAGLYLANSTTVADRIAKAYGINATVVVPPPAVTPEGPHRPVAGLPKQFALCVARLLPYKHVLEAVEGCREAGIPMVVVGDGPLARDVDQALPRGSRRLSVVDDDELRWLYAQASVLVAVAHEDLGLTPLEATAFATPVVALRRGGYLDTVVDGSTGIWVDDITPAAIAAGVADALAREWSPSAMTAHAEQFAAPRFHEAVRNAVDALLLM